MRAFLQRDQLIVDLEPIPLIWSCLKDRTAPVGQSERDDMIRLWQGSVHTRHGPKIRLRKHPLRFPIHRKGDMMLL